MVDGSYRDNEYTTADNTAVSRGYMQWDAMVNIPIMTKGTLYMGVDNIFDKNRTPRADGVRSSAGQIDNRPARGRYIFAGFKIRT